jgi:hypothetical protein
MREAAFDPSDAERVRLRVAVSDIERELSCLGREAPAAEHRAAIAALTAAWSRLVELLALGVAPELRDCPGCRNSVMRAATRCRHCWADLPPLTAKPLQ